MKVMYYYWENKASFLLTYEKLTEIDSYMCIFSLEAHLKIGVSHLL